MSRHYIRPASGRHPLYLHCQNPECVSVLDLAGKCIPVDYMTTLRERLQFREEDGLTAGTLDLFKECLEKGDTVSFAVMVAELAGGVYGEGGCRELLPCPWPYCDDCLEDVLKSRGAALNGARARQDAVCAYLTTLEQGQPLGAQEPPLPPPALAAALAEEERALLGSLADAVSVRDAAQARLTALTSRARSLKFLASSLWTTHREVSARLSAGRERMDALDVKCSRYREALGRIRSLRVHSDAFFIWHAEPFATINGARLGRTPGHPVEWHEVNAALGQLAMLLSITAARLGYVFQRWRIIPFGSYAKLGAAGDERAALLELSYDGSFFAPSRLSNALKPLLACMAELGEHVEKMDKAFRLPHSISSGGDKVGDLPTALGKDVPWTRAMRMAATNMKWLVAYAER